MGAECSNPTCGRPEPGRCPESSVQAQSCHTPLPPEWSGDCAENRCGTLGIARNSEFHSAIVMCAGIHQVHCFKNIVRADVEAALFSAACWASCHELRRETASTKPRTHCYLVARGEAPN